MTRLPSALDIVFGGAAVSAVSIVALSCPASANAQPITFSKDIAPIMWRRCATCHRSGEIGPFSLTTYDEVKRRATQIASVTARRIMPPWKPDVPATSAVEFDGSRRLTDAELHAIQQWVENGTPEGDRAELPPLPDFTIGWPLGPPDMVIRMREPYTLRADGGDVFRTFVVNAPTTRARYVRAIDFRPDNARVIHHANVGVDRTRSSRQLDARDPEPGYAGSMVQDARYPEGQLLGWTPGQAPHTVPPGTQWRLEPDSDFVLQLHLQPTGKPEPVSVSVGLYFTDEPPTRTPIGLRLGSETIDIPAGARQYVVSDRYVLPVDVDVLAVQPHAHNLARRMEARATRPDGTIDSLIAIADWDFRWQDVYRYVRPLVLPKGTAITMRYVYDNSTDNVRNPARPPGRVVWGQNTTDEMGDLWIQMVPRNPSDLGVLDQDVRRKAHADDIAAYTKLLEADVNNPLRHDAVAALYFEAGRIDDAIAHYGRSLQLNPSSASSHYNLGIAFSARGRRDEAIGQFEQALTLDPDYAQAHNNLGALLQLAGRDADALAHYRRATALRPDNLDAHTNMAQLLAALNRPVEAVGEFGVALALRDDHPPALAGLAFLRATASDPALRDSVQAVSLAERADQLTRHRDVSVLDALAAAYAAASRFDAAAEVARTAVQLATEAGLPDAAARLKERLVLYQNRRPYRIPLP